MAVNKLDPKVIFASTAPTQDTPAVFPNKTNGWGESRKNGGRPTIKQMNALQQETDLKILWLNENAITPYDATIDYPNSAVTIKDGTFKILDEGVWEDFISKDTVSKLKTIPTYYSAAEGIDSKTGVADGAYFNVRSSSNESYVVEYQNVGGSAVVTGKSYPSSDYVQNIAEFTPMPFVQDESYAVNQRVMLDNGDIVRSTIPENTTNPNLDLTNWFPERSAKNIIDSKGKNLEDFINGVYGDLNALSVFTKAEYESYLELGENFDATVQVQRAIDKAFDEKKRLFFPVLFNVYETLWLPVDNSFYGQDISKSQTKRFSGIRSRAAVAFKSKPVGPDTMPNTRFDCNRMYLYGNTTNTCLGKVKLQATEISECFIYNWEIFLDGLLGEVSHIHHNRIIAIGSNFITNLDNPNTYTLVDSYVHSNYINARANGTAILINLGTSSHFGIHDNYMDFAYQCIGSNGTPTNGAIYGNTFDISYRGIKLMNGIGLTVFGNTFPKNYKAQAANFNQLSGSPNKTLLETTDWRGIEIRSLQFSSMMGNIGESEGLIHVQGYTVRHVKTACNVNSRDTSKAVTLLISNGGAVSDDLKGLRFQELEYRTVTSLPTINPSIQTGTYEGDIVRFNDQVLVNNGTKWLGFDGSGLLYKASPSLSLSVIAANELYVSSAQTLTGIKLGDNISVSMLTPIDGLQVWGVVTAANQYKIYAKNQSNSATTTGNQSFNVQVRSS